LNAALDEIMAFVRGINKAVEDAAPWKSGKTDPEGTGSSSDGRWKLWPEPRSFCIRSCPANGALLSELGCDGAGERLHSPNECVKAGQSLPEKASLFPRVKFDIPEDTAVPQAESNVPTISIEDFGRLDLRVARIIGAEAVKGANKLLQLEVDLGGEKRAVVAGIAQHYRPEELIGKSVVLVANLQPTKIRGIESQGMLLAAQADGKLVLIAPEKEIAPGRRSRERDGRQVAVRRDGKDGATN